MNKQSINTFIKGINKDIDKSVISKDSYLDAYNFRITTSEGSSSGAFENIKGNKWIGSTGLLPVNQLICGAKRLRDYIVLFSTSNTGVPVHGVGRSMIHTLTLNKVTEEVGTLTTIYDDSLNAGVGADTLDFSTLNEIKVVSKYETPNIQKVYFTDGYNNLRYLNLAKPATIIGEAYTANDYMSTAMFEFLPLFTPSRPTLTDIVGGELMSGMVQYSYQLYRLNGASTAFSPVSDMIHIVSDGDVGASTLTYFGDLESINTGKGCKLSIVNSNIGYDRLRLVRVHYSTLNSVPVITVCNEIEISTSASTVTIIDSGQTISSLTLDEFNIESTELFACEDIASKDSRLFAANITRSDFKSDTTVENWDARAVRFRSSDNTAYLEDSTPANNITLAGDLSDWVAKYTEDHDGINAFNDHDNDADATKAYKYQAGGLVLGAEGLNVKIGFDTEAMYLDHSGSDYIYLTTPPTDSTDISYKDYSSPWKGGKLSWQRDETYRLFIEFGNDRGQVSIPKWMCDLRMPSFRDAGFSVLADDGALTPGAIATYRLFPTILLKTFPANATWARIHRVKRDRSDRNIVTQGLAIGSGTAVAPNTYYTLRADIALPATAGLQLIKLVSPEINIGGNISKQANDYLEYITTFDNYARNTSLDGGWIRTFNKLEGNAVAAYSANCRTNITEATMMGPATGELDSSVINNKNYVNYNPQLAFTDEGMPAKGCTGLVIDYVNANWTAEGAKYVLVNYKSNVFGSQYGGQTYEDRMLNIAIPCSDIILSSETNVVKNVEYGDTFINYFDISTGLFDLTKNDGNDCRVESVYVPLESSINCNLRSSTSQQHLTYGNVYSSLRQEYAGTHNSGDDSLTYIQDDDLYLYNTVYSQQTAVQLAISEMMDTPDETYFDCLVKASNIKYNGEISDSWTKFNINEEIEVDSNHGAILAINTTNDKLLFWQADAFGILSVNTRSLIQDSSSAQLALGSGGLLDRYDYISSTVGILDKFTIVDSDSSVYWFYDKDTSVYRFDNKLSNLTKAKGLWSWFKTNYSTSYKVHGVYDRAYNELIYTLYKSDQTGYTLAFNEQTDQFTSFYSFVPRMYIDYKDGYLSVKDFLTNTYSYLFMHNSNINPRCRFYSLLAYTVADTANTYASTVKLLYNDDYPITKVFDNIMYVSTSYAETTDIEQYATTFDRVRCYNDYQNTNWVTLTYGTNVMRRERGWTLNVPRNLVDHNYITNPDIFTDLAATKTWSERIRDKYMILDLSFNNYSQTRFVVPFIGIKYRISHR